MSKGQTIFLIIAIITGIAIVSLGWKYVSIPTYSSIDKTVTVVCGASFFYDMNNNMSNEEQLSKAEALASICRNTPPRNRTDWKKGSKQIANEKICVISWELSPAAHKIAYEEECTKVYPSN